MKIKASIFYVLAILVIGTAVSSCKKSDSSNPVNEDLYPPSIQNLVSQSMIDSIRSAGGIVYSGTTPPVVNGIYLMQPDSCTYDNSPSHSAGQLFVDYKFRFTNQNNTSFVINVDQKNMSTGVLNAVPAYTFISGAGYNFSIFTLRTATVNGLPANLYNIFSGTLTATGIQGFQNTLYVRSTTDPTTAPAGTIRVFVTGAPGLAATATVF